MSDPMFWHRLQFGFTLTFHYIFPQLTMGLALLIVVMKSIALRRGSEAWNDAARFWIRIFGLTFAMGVVTGIPMEFQFGTNWAAFSHRAGGVIGQTLAMEGIFAFFLESSFLAVLVWGERRFGPRIHYLASIALFAGSWLSGYFIIATNAFMQHPVGHSIGADGTFQIASLAQFVFNPWAILQFLHNQTASVVSGAFVVAAVGAYWTLKGETHETAKISLRTGVIAGLIASMLVAFPTGHEQGRGVAKYQPVTLAAMEGRFESGPHAPLSMIGQPNVEERKLDNPIMLPSVLSWIAYGKFSANVNGLAAYPESDWPDNIELLYYSFHIMVGLGTLFAALMGFATLMLWRGRLALARWMLWILALAFPFPFIANTAGWMTAEVGRQPWLIYGLMRTAEGGSPTVHSGATLFTTLGFAGLYFVLGVLFLSLIAREVGHGPKLSTSAPAPESAAAHHD
ncbi:MAG: cytochrome ubiquinol oxidase subunit I [Candidatus Eisenbacteria bacterium]|uniref:Cytochrome ubiquinol oxidase subunit I n=1 Tax=Eiseniibacteriota bacterium TaxID=2212470 RepID=A0A948WAS6_UNCEI|nr:cytochrome ubiquinol oxidase subunit I [Candidatus Eisenbacteria bacterium]MBU1948502.1 cytochrome ubiquinol oxidase subunit I [Candidatus Eisenbacteria bacterium]MBU2689318.1 cytochrome ubiquinol oxidase subunit I [Candidatus Eisenbacteria bacterium]